MCALRILLKREYRNAEKDECDLFSEKITVNEMINLKILQKILLKS